MIDDGVASGANRCVAVCEGGWMYAFTVKKAVHRGGCMRRCNGHMRRWGEYMRSICGIRVKWMK